VQSVWRPEVRCPVNAIGVAQSVHDWLTPLGKKVRRTPLSRQNWANAATTAVLVPSSTVNAS
jgi:hypothetical protein